MLLPLLQNNLLQGSSGDVGLTGIALAFAQDTLVPGMSKALTGQAATSAQGSVTLTITVPLTGQQITIGQGSVSAPGSVQAALTGIALTAVTGSFAPAMSVAMTGSDLTLGQGTPFIASGDPTPPESRTVIVNIAVSTVTVH